MSSVDPTIDEVWEALGFGTDDPEIVWAYIGKVRPRLLNLLSETREQLSPEHWEVLREVNLLLDALEAVSGDGRDGWEFRRKKAGKPINRRERAKQG
jgi:hypothetical protein